MWVVIVEWRGHNPPSTFYRRLRALTGASARGLRDGPSGAIVQESVVVVPSRDLAELVVEQIYQDAARFGWDDVEAKWAEIELSHPTVPDRVREVWACLNAQYARKGKPPAEKIRWWVTCLGCAQATVSEIRADYRPYLCPMCSSTRVSVTPLVGNGNGCIPLPSSTEDLLTRWRVSRFYRGMFRIPLETREGRVDPSSIALHREDERKIVDAISASSLLPGLEALLEEGGIVEGECFHFLDALFCALAGFTEEERREARLRVIFDYYQEAGVGAETLPLVSTGGLDPLDASAVLGADALVWWRLLLS
ncbi:MAG: hypothetical protein QW260_06205 [Thermoproteota archaeon]